MAEAEQTKIVSENASETRSKPGATKLALVSCGLGNVKRGFETSTARWYEALRRHTSLDVRLFCGGNYPGGKQLWNMPRNSLWTKGVHSLPFISEQHRWEWTYGVEQVSFWSALNFELLAWRPDVVWLKDFPLAHMVSASRNIFGLKFKIIFANGGLPDPNSYKELDFIQQIQPRKYEEALDLGIPRERMELLTNCFPNLDTPVDRSTIRKSLGLDNDDFVILCVAAWNKYHKRLDYLIDEVARLTDPKVKLVLCGAPEVDTRSLQEQGKKLLGNRIHWLTVDVDTIPSIMKASDVLVLPTLQEHLGNVLAESAMCGLPIITHPHHGARYIIQDEFWMTDLSEPGNLSTRLMWMRLNAAAVNEQISKLKADVNARFNEKLQAEKFESMVVKTLSLGDSRIGTVG